MSRGSGPGGQHVNKTSSRVELIFDLKNTEIIGEIRRERLFTNLKRYIDKEGLLHLVAESTRSQYRNKSEVCERFCDLIEEGLKVPKKRRKSKPSKASIRRRQDSKKKRSSLKKNRNSKNWD
jgi:ribosome-associated protein